MNDDASLPDRPHHPEYAESADAEPDSDELSADDLAILRAFDEHTVWATGPLPVVSPESLEDSPHDEESDALLDQMLMTFAAEIDEDIQRIQQALGQLEQNDTLDISRFSIIRRIGHKIRGTAGSVNCEAMGAIGAIIEDVVDQTKQEQMFPLISISILVQAVHALELTLHSLLETGHESTAPLKELETELEQLGVTAGTYLTRTTSQSMVQLDTETAPASSAQLSHEASSTAGDSSSPPEEFSPSSQVAQHLLLEEQETFPALAHSSHEQLPVDRIRFQQLVQRSELLAEQRTPLEDAQGQLRNAIEELRIAQNRLQQQARVFERLSASPSTEGQDVDIQDDHSISSLIARVLNRTGQHSPYTTEPLRPSAATKSSLHRAKSRLIRIDSAGTARTTQSTGNNFSMDDRADESSMNSAWDELELMRFTGLDEAFHALIEAVASMSRAATHVQNTYSRLDTMLQRYVTQAAAVRENALVLRLTSIHVLIERMQQVIHASDRSGFKPSITFTVKGEMIELDSAILETLSPPLLHLLDTCLADLPMEAETQQSWLHVQSIGNEVLLELGFSMTVQGGALRPLQETIQHIGGTLTLQRNTQGGVSFLLHVPRTYGTVRGLLVRVGQQQVIVPFSQIQHIDDARHAELDIIYYLDRLLDISCPASTEKQAVPVLVLPKGTSRLVAGVLVEEVLADVEVVVKPLSPYLQRPGITGATIDGMGHVQLLLNLPELVRYYNTVLRYSLSEQEEQDTQEQTHRRTGQKRETPHVLIADDSPSMRQSLQQTLQRAHYQISEASDGMEALEQLTREPPDVFLLDMEMPNLSGYDLLGIMHLYHELNDVKVIMLTSRSSEKHRSHALELGAHAYLTKPCAPDVLLETIATVLRRQ